MAIFPGPDQGMFPLEKRHTTMIFTGVRSFVSSLLNRILERAAARSHMKHPRSRNSLQQYEIRQQAFPVSALLFSFPRSHRDFIDPRTAANDHEFFRMLNHKNLTTFAWRSWANSRWRRRGLPGY